MMKIAKPKPKAAKPTDEQTAAEFYADIDAAFDRQIKELAAVLDWKPETVAGLIFESLNKFYWKGKTPFEICAQQHYWQFNFGYTSRKLRRECFLSNV